MITQKDLDEIEGRLKDTFVTKEDFTEYKSELFDKLDEIVKAVGPTQIKKITLAATMGPGVKVSLVSYERSSS